LCFRREYVAVMRNPYRLEHYYTPGQKKRRSRRKRAVRAVKQGAEDTLLMLVGAAIMAAVAYIYFQGQQQ
jgi:uncharacterized membrane protein SirB2